ncbi:AP endonuclease [Stereum hirsutum FP-91666 SS1]|uniref:AP endonuclease n=1 Tax=Stereum hirsutum (strain FP-91666) TaxID=721885 RepID=UPI000440D083|nr:AP endonuclease [Stereum hirsutum FP-91666 SS1]EIM89548.1 AP endonuclease [Stereum hirsutum FP-91666 SS1]
MVSTRSSSAAKLGIAPPRAVKRRKLEVEEDNAEATAEHEAMTSEMNIIVQTQRVAETKKKTVGPALTEEVPLQETVAKESTKKRTRKKSAPSEFPEDYPRRVNSPWKVGAHVSAAGGVENAILNAARIGANAFALFLKSQHKWVGPPFSDDSISTFNSRLKTFGYSPHHILPHGSYLINLGNPDAEKREKAYQCFLDELQRCEQLGLLLYNFHPGSTVGLATPDESIGFIAESINRAHMATKNVVPVIENMAGAGNVIGSKFEELAGIIARVKDRSRVGVCLDTCHMFAAGYDIRTKEGWECVLSDFDRIVGLKYLRGMHLNDSKATLASKKDRHENIGLGELRLTSFAHILTDSRMQNIPLVLETPMRDDHEVWRTEVAALNRLSNTTNSRASTTTGPSAIDESITVGEAEVRSMVAKHGGGKEKGTSKGKDKARRGKPKEVAENDAEEGERPVDTLEEVELAVEVKSKGTKKERASKKKRG